MVDFGDGLALTVRQAQLIKNLTAGMTLEDASKSAGYKSPTVKGMARSGGHVAESANGREALRKAFAHAGVNASVIAKTVRDGLRAERREIHQPTGRVVTLGPDHKVRKDFAELAMKAEGMLPERVELTGAGGGAIVIRATPGLDDL